MFFPIFALVHYYLRFYYQIPRALYVFPIFALVHYYLRFYYQFHAHYMFSLYLL